MLESLVLPLPPHIRTSPINRTRNMLLSCFKHAQVSVSKTDISLKYKRNSRDRLNISEFTDEMLQ